jgi:hypothetical protein
MKTNNLFKKIPTEVLLAVEKRLSEEELKLFVDNFDLNFYNNGLYVVINPISASDAIRLSFSWGATEEKSKFWYKIYCKLLNEERNGKMRGM